MNLGSIRSPGLVVVVCHRGEVVYQECRGTVDLESEAPVTLETAFDLASVSKQFTAALVMQLVEAGLLELSTPLSRFQPFDDEKWSGVTVESLLSHTSGLPDYLHGNVDLTKEVCLADVMRRLARQPRRFAPGTRWQYSNSGYAVLGYLVELLGEYDVGSQMQCNVLEPLAIRGYVNGSRDKEHIATGYEWNGCWVPRPHVSNVYRGTGDGMMAMSAASLLKWHKALVERRLLKAETWERMWTPCPIFGTPGYGFGWVIDRPGKNPRISHRGEYLGATSWMISDLETDSCIVVLANADETGIEAVEVQLLDMIDGK